MFITISQSRAPRPCGAMGRWGTKRMTLSRLCGWRGPIEGAYAPNGVSTRAPLLGNPAKPMVISYRGFPTDTSIITCYETFCKCQFKLKTQQTR